MMRFMQKGIFSGLFMAILLLGGFGLVLTDWTGSFRGGVASNDVAKVAGDRIGAMEFGRLVGRVTNAENIQPEQAYQMGLVTQILTSEIWSRMLQKAAHTYGLRVGDEQLTTYLKELAEGPAKEQKVLVSAVLQNFLRNSGMSEPEFLNQMRRDRENDLVRKVLNAGSGYVSPLVERDLLANDRERRSGKLMVLKDDVVADIGVPDEKTLNTLYDARKVMFMMPERRTVRVGTLPRAQMAKDVRIDDAEIRAFYDTHADAFARPEERRLDQALYKSDAEADAQKLVDTIKSGGNLVDTSKTIGKPVHTGSDAFTKDGMLPDLAEPVFAAKPGDVIGPVKSPMGWHVVRVVSITPAGKKSFEESKETIRARLMDEKVGTQIDSVLDGLDTAHEAGTGFDQIVKEHGLAAQTFADITREGKTPADVDAFKDLAEAKAKILTAAFTLTSGQVSPPLELSNGDIAVIDVTAITPATPKPLAEVKAQLVQDWQREQRQQKNLSIAQAIVTDLTSKAKTIEAAAAEKGLKLISFDAALRDRADLPAGVNRPGWLRLFQAQVNEPVLQPVDGGVMIALVSAAHLPDTVADEEARGRVLEEAKKGQNDETMVQFMGFLSDRYPSKVNDRLLKQMFAPKEAAE